MGLKLSILIPSLVERKEKRLSLLRSLNEQIKPILTTEEDYDTYTLEKLIGEDVEVLILTDNREMTIGAKRNLLVSLAKGEYLCHVDCDDMVVVDYVSSILNAIQKSPDCCSLRGIITINGGEPEIFEHSIKYDKWETVDYYIKYLRFPNHLNTIKTSIAKQYPFPEKNFSEDFEQSTAMHEASVLKTEIYIDKVLYYYTYISNK